MQQQTSFGPLTLITPTAALKASVHGGRAKCLQRLVRMDLPVPITVALSFDAVHAAAVGDLPDMDALLAPFGGAPLLSVRPSSEDPDWGGPSAILNVGMNDARHAELINHVGEEAATRVYLRFVQSYAIHVARLDPDEFHIPDVADRGSLVAMMATYEAETDEAFPQDARVQLARSYARWRGHGMEQPRVFCAKQRVRPQMLGLVWLCRRWPWGQGGANAEKALFNSLIRRQVPRALLAAISVLGWPNCAMCILMLKVQST